MSLSAILTHSDGFTQPVLAPGKRIRRLSNGLDAGTALFTGLHENDFAVGQQIAALPGMFVDEVDSVQNGDIYDHTVACSGLLTGERMVLGYPKKKINLEDWDTVEAEMLTTNERRYRKGMAGNFGGTTVCISASSEPANAHGTVFRVRGSFKGIIEPKGYRRVVTCNGMVISGDQITVNLPQGWTTPRKGTAALSKIVVTDTYFATSPPPTSDVPGMRAPPDAPAVKVLTFSGTDVTSHWPSGWVFTCGYRKLAETSLYENDWIYEWTPQYTP